ncbi:hypothetical protein [Ensifer sp. 22564]|uniref:hypothetical protein n=1 Tax=Ensifer sp. 22564 TaxID=3453943 RepID=UPI003F880261
MKGLVSGKATSSKARVEDATSDATNNGELEEYSLPSQPVVSTYLLSSRTAFMEQLTKRVVTLVSYTTGRRRRIEAEVSSGGRGLLGKSFLICVLLPAVVALLYSSVWASNIYVVESKLTVREAIDPDGTSAPKGMASAGSLLGSLGISRSTGTAQDALIILDYLKSRSIVSDIGGRVVMSRYYNRPGIDYLSRLGQNEELEALWYYWRDHVVASVDTQSNILTVKVHAYSREDAYELSRAVLTKSEALVNRISERNRQDALRRAENEVDRSIAQLADTRSKLLAFQQVNNSLDPIEKAKQYTMLISTLSTQKIAIESRLAAAQLSGATDRPTDRYAHRQLEAIQRQIADLESKLTNRDDPKSVAQLLKEFEILKLRQTFAEQVYTLARTSYEEARRKLDKQQLYAVVVVPPMVPEEALYPRPVVNTMLVFSACFIAWAIIALIVAGIRDST